MIGADTERVVRLAVRCGITYKRRNWEGQKLFEKLQPIPKLRDDLAKIQHILAYTGKADPLYKVTECDLADAAGALARQMNYYHDCICANSKWKILKPRELRIFKMRFFHGLSIPEIAARLDVRDLRTVKRMLYDDYITRIAVVMYSEGWMPWAGEKPENEP